MNVTQVTVSSHEKRNHPFEYGHYDAEVRFTAELAPGEDVIARTKELQYLAGSLVAEKCDVWIGGIRQERAIEEANQTFRRRLSHAVHTDDEAEVARRLDELDAWALDQAQRIGLWAASNLRAMIESAREKWRASRDSRGAEEAHEEEDGDRAEDEEENELGF